MRRLLPLFLLLTLLLTSCTEQPRLRVSAGHMTITPYEAFLGATTWQQHGWLAADGLPITGRWEEHADKLPTLHYRPDLRVIIRDDLIVDSVTISVYNAEKPDKGLLSAKLSDLDDLPEGSYYVCITVYFLGEYIEAGNGHEKTGLQYAFILQK
ncbi:MAG: hypothetical protein IKM07_06800 [Clostridia bacterium]|nr:hypothetical protein [Clostridia bacterium]